MAKKIFFSILLFLAVYGCGKTESKEPLTCSVARISNGAKITCPDGSSATIFDGYSGKDGSAGASGDMGEHGIDGVSGATGAQGVTGATGANGSNGVTEFVVLTDALGCYQIDSVYIKRTASTSARIYSIATCTGTNEQITSTGNEVYWVDNSTMLTIQQNDATNPKLNIVRY